MMLKKGALIFGLVLSLYIESCVGIKCLQCATADPSNTGQDVANCASGQNLNATDCEASGWGSSCITRVFTNSEAGSELFLRSCLAPEPMTCDEGHAYYGEHSEYGTHCCDSDGCNNYDPRDEFTTTETEEETQACISGVGLEENGWDCPANGWGESCIAQ